MTTISTVDPVCGKRVAVDEGQVLVYGAVELRFCSDECRREFLRNPHAYLDIPAKAHEHIER